LAGSIVSDGHAEWILNPLSYFGWYPLSYPSAGPFLLATLTVMTEEPLEASILSVSLILGPIGILGAFIMAREFRRDNLLALGVALFYGVAPRFLAFTMWSASTRNLFMAMLPFLVWALLLNYRKRTVANVLVLGLIVTIQAATHRLVILAAAVVLAFLLAIMVVVFTQILRIRIPKIVLHNAARKWTPYLALALVVVVSAGMLAGTDVLEEYSEGELGSGSSIFTQLMNLAVSIARSGGLALPLVLVGLVVITKQRNKTIGEPFLALTLLALVPTLSLRLYTGFYILPFLSLFGGLGFVGIVRAIRKRPRLAVATGVSLVLGISAFSAYILEVEISRATAIDNDTYTTGLYVLDMGAPGSMIANEGLTGVRVAAVAGVNVLPVGGAGTTFQSPELLAYRYYSAEEVYGRIVRVDVGSVTIDSDSLWVATGVQAEADWVVILESPYGSIPNRLSRYKPSYFLEVNQLAGSYFAYDNTYCSDLGLSVRENGYRIYDNGIETIWWLHSPGITPQQGEAPRCP
jgi:succinate dehydrogenase hydrophobic anchor subunit